MYLTHFATLRLEQSKLFLHMLQYITNMSSSGTMSEIAENLMKMMI